MTSTAPPTSTPREPLADGLGILCLDGLDTAVVVADANLKVVYGNPSARRTLRGVASEIERAFGTPISDVVGVPLHHLFGDVGRVAAPDPMPRVSTITVGLAILRVQVSSLRSPRGDLLGYSAQFANITTETQREGARRAQAAEADSRERRQLEDLSSKTQGLLDAVQAAMAGDLTHAIEVRGDDALGHIAANLAGFFSHLRTNVGSIGAVAQTLGTAADALDETSRHMGDNAGSTAKQAAAAASAADVVSSNINTVAAGTEELGASIREIARSAADALRIASDAVDAAEETNASIHKLGESSVEIGNVVKVITSIAQQTNLLALNATIEAARAGDAGRGFAVVANEVKELAKETAKATNDIGRRIEAIQTGTKGAVEAIKRITEIIHQVNAIQTSIATAVEEQSATTNEISRSIAQAATGAAAISTTVSEVAQSAGDTSQGATNVRGAAADLTRLAVDLRDLISGFTV